MRCAKWCSIWSEPQEGLVVLADRFHRLGRGRGSVSRLSRVQPDRPSHRGRHWASWTTFRERAGCKSGPLEVLYPTKVPLILARRDCAHDGYTGWSLKVSVLLGLPEHHLLWLTHFAGAYRGHQNYPKPNGTWYQGMRTQMGKLPSRAFCRWTGHSL